MNLPDRNVGIQAMSDAGAHLTTFQQLIFELLRTTEHPEFKGFLPLLKDGPPASEALDLIAWDPKLWINLLYLNQIWPFFVLILMEAVVMYLL